MELQLEFKTSKFRLSGPLPEHINAGNQFYGQDVAEWLCATLSAWQFDYMDEDWGWLVFSTRQSDPANERNQICVYAYPAEHQETTNDGAWMLALVTEYESKRFWFLKGWKQGPYNRRLAADLCAALRQLGVEDFKQTEGAGPK